MIKNNFFLKKKIQSLHLNNGYLKNQSLKFKKIFSEISTDVHNTNKNLNVLDKNFKFNFNIKDLKKFKKFSTIALIGMGGSILGAEAIHNFLNKKIKKRVFFFNNLDEDNLTQFKKKENLSKILFIVISKSGNTIETISNAFSLNIMKKNSKNVILISEKKNNLLFFLSKKLNLFHLEHKDYIGGRYSVLSEVGLVPAYLMGINIFKLRSNIQRFLKKKNKIFLKKSALQLSSLFNSKKYNNLIFLNYSPELEKFLYWSQQLIAESLGKKNKGFLPVISNAPKDHHSLLQLYLDGPKDKLFYIFSFDKKSKKKLNISNDLLNYLSKKSLSTIKNAQKNSLIKSFLNNKIPFREIKIRKLNEKVLGELFSYFILETIILGKLSNINPYDQPAVEQIKKYTKQLLL